MKRKNFFKLNIGEKKTKILKQNRLLLLSFLFFFLFSAWVKVFAFAWPYNPGLILDPGCAPTDSDCTVSLLGSLNGLNGSAQTFSTGTSGSDFNIDSAGTVHTFNFPTASSTKRGLLSSSDWSTFNGKQDALIFNLPLQNISNNISINVADTGADGYLTSADWNTFNNKLQSSDFITSAGNNNNGIAVSISNQLSSTSLSVTTTVADNSNTGVLSSTDWSTFNSKEDALTFSTGLTRSINTITNNLSTGVSGGQSVVGGIASGENLTLSSTVNGTKGSIFFGNSIYDEANNRMAIGDTVFDGTNPEKFFVNAGTTSSVNAIVAKGTIDNYFQLNIRNLSAGTSASSDVVATADNGSETTGYIDMGINSSGYNSGVMGVANDAYLYNIAAGTGGDLVIGAGSSGKSLYLLTGGTSKTTNNRFKIDGTGNATFTQGVASIGSPTALTVTGASHSGLTASTEASDININLARTVTFQTGALTTQRAFKIQAPTYAFVSTSTITDAATFAVTGAPVKSTNATITSSHGILVQAGAVSTATAAYGLTVNAPTGATTNIAAQFLDAATMSGAETFYPAIDVLRTGGTEGVKIGYWSRSSGTAEGGAIMSRSANGLILGNINSGTPQRALTIRYDSNSPSMFLGTSTSPNTPYDFGMAGAITFYSVPNTTKWTGLVSSGLYTLANGAGVYSSAGVNGSSFGDLVLSSRSISTAMVGIVTGTTPTVRMKIDATGNTTFTQGVATTGSPVALTLTGAAHTTLTASTEAPDVNFNLARTVQFATGALTTQRAFRLQAPTYGFVGSSTITDAATLAVSGAPVAGTNATITNSHALLVSAGAVASGTTRSYGLTVNAQTGASGANYAAQFIGGNVGIGIATPLGPLHVMQSSTGSMPIYFDAYGANSTNSTEMYFRGYGGTFAAPITISSTSRVLRIVGQGYDGSAVRQMVEIIGSADGSPASSTIPGKLTFHTTPSGGSSTERMRIDSTGNVSIVGLISCAGLQTNASGLLSCTSDQNLKDIRGEYTRGLDAIMGITPKTYSWKTDSYLNDGGALYSGVIAQNVEEFIPEAVNTGALGYKQVSQMTLLVTAINAIKEINLKVEGIANLDTNSSFVSLFKTWLSDTSNGITKLFAKEVQTDKLCIGQTCVTEDQLQLLLQAQNIQNNNQTVPDSNNISQDNNTVINEENNSSETPVASPVIEDSSINTNDVPMVENTQ